MNKTLTEQARALGIEPTYNSIDGNQYTSSDEILHQLIDALTPQQPITPAYDNIHALTVGDIGEIPIPEVFLPADEVALFDEHQTHYPLRLPEHGDIALPNDGLPCGYYTLRVRKGTQHHLAKIIVAPPQAYQPEHRPYTGLTIQLYALRSAQNWGIGDLADLAGLMRYCKTEHIDFIGINPLHALFTRHFEHTSPYSPSSRIWLNPIYISVPQAAQFLDSHQFHHWLQQHSGSLKALRDSQDVDYQNIWQVKLSALQDLFQEFESSKAPLATQQRQQFADFMVQKGNELRGFALFETLDNAIGDPNYVGWQGWDAVYQHPDNPEVQEFSAKHEHEIRFHMWLQWLCAVQLAQVQQVATECGVSLGVYGDLAVGVARGGADTWLKRDQYCLDLSVGAPPDPFSPIGQNWGLPPYHPQTMRQTGCTEFIKVIRENMKLYGVLRIDHVMALNRLWLMVEHNTADRGAYVHYPQEALFAIVALESHRHQCVVIGEDLGTVPDLTSQLLERYEIYSYKVLYFHQNAAKFPSRSIAVTSTHDLAPLAGFWSGADLQAMRQLGTLPDDAAFQAAYQQRELEKSNLIQLLVDGKYLPNTFRQPETLTDELMLAIHAFGSRSAARLYALQLENVLGMTSNFNFPGVGVGNWVQKYPITLEDLSSDDNIHQQLQLIKENRMLTTAPYPKLDSREIDTINALFEARHGDVFAYLGRHQMAGVGDVVRVLQPKAANINVVDRKSGKLLAIMQKIDDRGFWVAVLPENAQNDVLSIQDQAGEWREQADPYRYGSILGDTDNWLLGEGKHLRPYERLGAHLREIDGVKGAYFAVWAPNAKRVSVIGEFNDWDGRIHVMRHHHDTGVWEIFIPAVPYNALYKFEILDANDRIRVKSDPYAFATELRPTTASVLRGLPDKMPIPTFRQAANRIDAPISIYEVHLGSWKRQPENNAWLTYQQLADELIDYVQYMGFTHIEFLPLSEYPFDGSWGYQATGLYAPTSRFGSPQELQYLVQKAHDAGIGVILDWVVGHFPTDEHGLATFDGTPLYEHADPREGFHQDWNTLIYNFGRNEVRNFLTGNALYWVERFGFDGLRVDAVASMIYRDYSRKDGEWIPNQFGGRENLEAIDFLRDTNIILQSQQLDAVSMAEESTSFPNVTRLEGLNFQFKWNMGWMNDTLRYMQQDPIARKHHHGLMTFGMMYQYSENYVLPLSHDEVVHGKGSLLSKMPGDCWQKFANLRAYYGFMYGFPGKKLLFMGNEFAQGREWNFDDGLDWFLLDEAQGGGWHKGVQDYVRQLNHVYRDYAPMSQLDQWSDGFEWLVVDDSDHSVFVFERLDKEGNRVIVISNFTPVVRENYRFGVRMAGEYTEILNSDHLDFKGSGVSLAGSLKTLATENVASHHREHSLCLTLPPLATVYLYAKHQTLEPKVSDDERPAMSIDFGQPVVVRLNLKKKSPNQPKP